MEESGQYFDGESASAHTVRVSADGSGLSISGPTIRTPRRWPFEGLEAIATIKAGQTLRLKHRSFPGERLVVEDLNLAGTIIPHVVQRQTSLQRRTASLFALGIAAGLLCLVLLAYLLLTVMPSVAAQLMPEQWRQRLGEQAQKAFLHGYNECSKNDGRASLQALATRLYLGHAELAPDFSVQVYKLPVVNAFALPGGRIILSSPLIAAATSPEEVAGVLAHELGHVWNRDPEVSLIRMAGLQLLVSMASGSEGGSTMSNLMGLATLLRYTRAAEERADAYAQDLMNATKVDPMGLKRFFERMKANQTDSGTIGTLGNILSTHPGTEERIAKIKPLNNGSPQPVLDDQQWQALKDICG